MPMYGLTPPGHGGPIESLAFSAYAYNQQQIETFIDRLAAEEDPNDSWVQARIACSVGINLDHLTASEIDYIEREVANRR